jgi:hypothetical protein
MSIFFRTPMTVMMMRRQCGRGAELSRLLGLILSTDRHFANYPAFDSKGNAAPFKLAVRDAPLRAGPQHGVTPSCGHGRPGPEGSGTGHMGATVGRSVALGMGRGPPTETKPPRPQRESRRSR